MVFLQGGKMSNQHRGRSTQRTGAGLDGTLFKYQSRVIDARMAEREKSIAGDRALEMYTNAAVPHGVLEGGITDVVGTGLTPIPNPMQSLTKMSAKKHEKYVETVMEAWEIFTKDSRNFCDVMRRNSDIRLQQYAEFSWRLAGIGVFQLIRRKEKFKPYDLEILAIDPYRLLTPSDKSSNNNIYDGVEIDQYGKPVAVWIARPEKMAFYSSVSTKDCQRIPVFDEKTGLRNILLVCDTRNISEYRQDGILTPMLKELRDSQDAVDAVIVKYVLSNQLALFVQNQSDQLPENGTNWQDRITYTDAGMILHGTINEVPTILESSKQPSQQYELLMRSILERLGMVTGKGYEDLTRQYQTSFSAAKANIGKAGIKNNMERLTLIETFCDPIMQAFQFELAVKGITKVSDINYFIDNLYAYTRTSWLPQGEHIIDEYKRTNSNKLGIETGQLSYATIYGKENTDWKQAFRQVAIELQEVKKLEKEFDVTLPFYKNVSQNVGTPSGFESKYEMEIEDAKTKEE